VLLILLARRVAQPVTVGASVLRSLVCAVLAAGVARVLADALPGASRAEAALTVVVAGGAAALVYAGIQWALRAPEFRGVTTS